jgi:tripartite-type tricarboxylate transporter receptor subunit TctC
VLGVTLKQRSPALPNVPTISEFLPAYEAVSWVGLFAPPGTPRELVAKLQHDVWEVLQQTDIRERMAAIATVPDGRSPADFAAFVKADIDRWRRVVASGHIKVEE